MKLSNYGPIVPPLLPPVSRLAAIKYPKLLSKFITASGPLGSLVGL